MNDKIRAIILIAAITVIISISLYILGAIKEDGGIPVTSASVFITSTPLPSPSTEPQETSTPIPSKAATPVASLKASPSPTFVPGIPGDNVEPPYHRTYKWSYKNIDWTFDTDIAYDVYYFYKDKPHNLTINYAYYAMSDEDRPYLQGILEKFREAGMDNGYTEYDNVMNVVRFVQSLPYTSDSVTTRFDEYPRYPVETLVDSGGDCEDTSILTAALLHEMGYDVVLLKFPDHMGVGVMLSSGLSGSYYEYEGQKYYYLETTGENWEIGQIPPEFSGSSASIYPLIKPPSVEMSFNAKRIGLDDTHAHYRVSCEIKNSGPGSAIGLRLRVMALAISMGENMIWPPDNNIDIGIMDAGSIKTYEVNVKVPINEYSVIRCLLTGENIEQVEMRTDPFKAQ